jgi:hypothetical protein
MEVLARSDDHECEVMSVSAKAICLGLSGVGCTRDVLESSATASDKRIGGAVLSIGVKCRINTH